MVRRPRELAIRVQGDGRKGSFSECAVWTVEGSWWLWPQVVSKVEVGFQYSSDGLKRDVLWRFDCRPHNAEVRPLCSLVQ